MPRFQATALARIAWMLLDQAERMGLARDELTRAAGLEESEMADPDSRIDVTKLWNLWRLIIERSHDPALGLRLGSTTDVRQFGLVGYTMLHSRTLGEALHRMVRYTKIISEATRFGLERVAGGLRMVVEPSPRFDTLRQPIDGRLAAALSAARTITQREIVPREVQFTYERPPDIGPHQQVFRCPLKFEQPRSLLDLREEDLALPVTAADDQLCAYLDAHAENVLQSIAETGTFTDRVRRAIWDELSGGQPSLSRIASVLGISQRTLQRRLQDEHTTFAELLDRFRQEMALNLLRDRSLAIYEIAFLLGYAEPSTFHRAFRRWQGSPPHEFRQAM